MTGFILFLIVAAYVACIIKKKRVDAELGVKRKARLLRSGAPDWMLEDRTGFSLSLLSMAPHENNEDLYND